MKRERWVKGFAIIAAGIVCFSACSKKDEEKAEAASAEKIVLTVAARGGTHTDVIQAMKGEFEQKHNCTVNVLGFGADDLKQRAALDAINRKGVYDLGMIDDPVMPEFTENGVLQNLTAMGYKDDKDFVEKSAALGKSPYAKGDTYALPFTGNVQLFFYNESVLKESGTALPASWEDVLKTAKKIKSAGKAGYVIRGQQGNPIVSDFLPVLWAYGGNVFDENWNVIVDSPEAKKALKMYCDLFAAGANYEKNDIVASVANGNAGMALGWPSWFISSANAQAAYAAVPDRVSASSAQNATGMIGNWMMGITANSTHKELALKLLTYLTSAEVQKAAVDKGGVPTRTSVFTDSAITAKYPYFSVIYEGTKNSVVRPRTPKWSAVENAFGIELSNVVSAGKNIDTGLADAKKAIEEIMKK